MNEKKMETEEIPNIDILEIDDADGSDIIKASTPMSFNKKIILIIVIAISIAVIITMFIKTRSLPHNDTVTTIIDEPPPILKPIKEPQKPAPSKRQSLIQLAMDDTTIHEQDNKHVSFDIDDGEGIGTIVSKEVPQYKFKKNRPLKTKPPVSLKVPTETIDTGSFAEDIHDLSMKELDDIYTDIDSDETLIPKALSSISIDDLEGGGTDVEDC